MGSPQPGYSGPLMKALTGSLGLAPSGPTIAKSVQRPAEAPGLMKCEKSILTISGYKDVVGRRLIVYEVTWAPLIADLKNLLAEDSSEARARQRLLVNRTLKRSLINERLADPVIYLGTPREDLQYPVKYAVCDILGGQLEFDSQEYCQPKDVSASFASPNCGDGDGKDCIDLEDDEIAIITYSLGSKITYDAIQRLLAPASPSDDLIRQRFASRVGTIYMLANQLPLLELADGKASSADVSLREIGDLVARQSNSSTKRRNTDQRLTVVAMSDPNDLLSYDITDAMAIGARNIRFVNVDLYLARRWGFVANPLGAHTGHDRSSAVVRLIANGTPRSK